MTKKHFVLLKVFVGFVLSVLFTDIVRADDSMTATALLMDMDAHPYQNLMQNRDRLMSLGPTAIPALREYYKNPKSKEQVRAYALEAIYRIAKTDATRSEIREACLKDKDVRFRASCYMMMGRTKDVAFRDVYLKAINTPTENAGVQVMSAMGLSILGDRHGYNRALQSIQKPDGWQDFGMMTLEFLKAREALPILESTLKGTTNYSIINSCRLATLRLNLIDKDTAGQIDLLEQALEEDGYFDVRGWASRKLVRIGTKEAGKSLSKIANNAKAPGRNDALSGLMTGVQEKYWTNEDIRNWK